LPFLRFVASKGKPLLISTGMCDLADVHEAVEVVRAAKNNDIVLLQCTGLYPTPAKNVNLNVMRTLRTAFNSPVGFSDHTLGLEIPFAAVAMGARVIEKHFTLSRKLKGPDHSYALEPSELKSLVKGIRDIERAFGSSDKEILVEEKKYARRESLYAAVDIAKGEKITSDKLISQRPALGIRPRYLKAIVERRAKTTIKKGQGLTWEMINND
jgi:N-acetylneuraminate synthase/N,N'-diacetyllegionaminate synthase